MSTSADDISSLTDQEKINTINNMIDKVRRVYPNKYGVVYTTQHLKGNYSVTDRSDPKNTKQIDYGTVEEFYNNLKSEIEELQPKLEEVAQLDSQLAEIIADRVHLLEADGGREADIAVLRTTTTRGLASIKTMIEHQKTQLTNQRVEIIKEINAFQKQQNEFQIKFKSHTDNDLGVPKAKTEAELKEMTPEQLKVHFNALKSWDTQNRDSAIRVLKDADKAIPLFKQSLAKSADATSKDPEIQKITVAQRNVTESKNLKDLEKAITIINELNVATVSIQKAFIQAAQNSNKPSNTKDTKVKDAIAAIDETTLQDILSSDDPADALEKSTDKKVIAAVQAIKESKGFFSAFSSKKSGDWDRFKEQLNEMKSKGKAEQNAANKAPSNNNNNNLNHSVNGQQKAANIVPSNNNLNPSEISKIVEQSEISKIVEQMVQSTNNPRDIELSLIRTSEVSYKDKVFAEQLEASGFEVESCYRLEETIEYLGHRREKITNYPVKATFKFNPAVISNTPAFAQELENQSKIKFDIKEKAESNPKLGDVEVTKIARYVAMNPDNTIEITVNYDSELMPNEKKPMEFIDQLKKDGLVIVGEADITYDNVTNAYAPDTNKPTKMVIKVKYDAQRPDSRIAMAVGNVSGNSNKIKNDLNEMRIGEKAKQTTPTDESSNQHTM